MRHTLVLSLFCAILPAQQVRAFRTNVRGTFSRNIGSFRGAGILFPSNTNPNPQTQETLAFSPDGVVPDGTILFTNLTPANLTVPVVGVPGLTATFNFGVNPNFTATTGAELNFQYPPVNFTITFSQPIQGISLLFRSADRFGHVFTMSAATDPAWNWANVAAGQAPIPAQVQSAGVDMPTKMLQTAPLELLARYRAIQSVQITSEVDPNELGFLSLVNLRIQSGLQANPAAAVPTTGLKAWFAADSIPVNGSTVTPIDGILNVASWPSLVGGIAATPNSLNVQTLIDGPRGNVVVAFRDTQTQFFSFPTPGLNPASTIILVAQAYSTGAQTAIGFPGILGIAQDMVTWDHAPYIRTVNAGADFTITTIKHDQSFDTLFVNGIQVAQYRSVQANTSGLDWMVGQGNIAETLWYTRAISAAEQATIELYLRGKYGI